MSEPLLQSTFALDPASIAGLSSLTLSLQCVEDQAPDSQGQCTTYQLWLCGGYLPRTLRREATFGFTKRLCWTKTPCQQALAHAVSCRSPRRNRRVTWSALFHTAQISPAMHCILQMPSRTRYRSHPICFDLKLLSLNGLSFFCSETMRSQEFASPTGKLATSKSSRKSCSPHRHLQKRSQHRAEASHLQHPGFSDGADSFRATSNDTDQFDIRVSARSR